MFVSNIGNEYSATGTPPLLPRCSPHFQAAIMREIHPESRHVVNKRQFNWYNVLMVVAMSMGAFGYGYTNAVIGPTLGELPSTTQRRKRNELTNLKPSQVSTNTLSSRSAKMPPR